MTLYAVDFHKHINIEFIQSINLAFPGFWRIKTADGCDEYIVGPFDSIEDLLADIKKKSIRV